jgi:hypothetical protein
MVSDQIVHRTAAITVELCADRLCVDLSQAAAAKLHGETRYEVPLDCSRDELLEIDAALAVIFARTGRYIRNLQDRKAAPPL